MKVALISDVHLEYNTFNAVKLPKADVLVCAGDIGSPHTYKYQQFIESATKKYDHVIVVTGNHEYYQHSSCHKSSYPLTISLTNKKIKEVCERCGATFLNKKFVDIGDVRFYGCTLWADPFASGGEAFWKDRYDYKHITDFENIEDYVNKHNEHRLWLKKSLESAPKDKTIVVVTHHLPSYELIEPKFAGSSYNGYYVSACDELVEMCDVWLGGHTHIPISSEVCGTKVYCNPVGYPWESDLSHNDKLIITV